MTTQELFVHCHRLGLVLTARDGKLLFDAPAGTMTDALKVELVARKPEVLEVLPRLAGMLLHPEPIPTAKSATDAPGGPGQCFSCGVVHEHAEAFWRCQWCWVAVEAYYAIHGQVDDTDRQLYGTSSLKTA